MDTGAAVAAALYTASNVFSWSEARKMPKLQAEANKQVLALQKQHYDAVSAEQRSILNAAITEYLNSIDALLNGFDFEEAFPEVPVAAEYVPVDACCLQGSTIECNISHTARADAYVRYVNRLHEQNDLLHGIAGNPNFLVDLNIQTEAIHGLMRGQMPTGDAVELLTDNAEMAALTGRIGNTRRTVARDFGISRLRLQAAGRREFREMTTWFCTVVSPQSRQADIRDMMQRPQDRIALALTQAQLIQNSLQNRNNALAQKDPYLMAKLQTRIQSDITRLQQKANEALLTNTHVPNYAATIFPKLNNISGLVGGIGQAIQYANTSHFFGPPPQSQDGYRGQTSGVSGQAGTGRSPFDWGETSSAGTGEAFH